MSNMRAHLLNVMARGERRDQARDEFPEAAERAKEHGLVLARMSGRHYRLIDDVNRWGLDIYPANHRLLLHMGVPPLLKNLPKDWGLLDIVDHSMEL